MRTVTAKPRLLDLFSGAGGAARGYQQAGFYVVGVDHRPQPRYAGDEFMLADALTYPLDGFDAIHASPPCQGYSPHVTSRSSRYVGSAGKDEPRLIAAVRERMPTDVPWVIENVMGSADELAAPVMLCGQMFGLDIPRHRLFEASIFLLAPPHANCRGIARDAAVRRGWDYRDMTVTGKGRRKGTANRWMELLGIDWKITQHGLSEAIPPAFTEWIGAKLMRVLRPARV